MSVTRDNLFSRLLENWPSPHIKMYGIAWQSHWHMRIEALVFGVRLTHQGAPIVPESPLWKSAMTSSNWQLVFLRSTSPNPKPDILIGPARARCPPWTNHPWRWSRGEGRGRTPSWDEVLFVGTASWVRGQLLQKGDSSGSDIHCHHSGSKCWVRSISLIRGLADPEIIGSFILSPASE